jgi:hypothetical protein
MPYESDFTTIVNEYLGNDHSWTPTQILNAIEAEKSAQAKVCRVPATREVSVTTTSGSPTVTSDAAFLASDVGWEIDSTNTPEGAVIVTFGTTSSVTLSANATASGAVTATLRDVWPSDLVEALCRRVARNLAMRALPLAVQMSNTDMGAVATRLGSSDPEVRRLEAPYRRLVVA